MKMNAFIPSSSSLSSSSSKRITVFFLVLLLIFPVESRRFLGDPLTKEGVGMFAKTGLRRQARQGVFAPPTPEPNHDNPGGPNPLVPADGQA